VQFTVKLASLLANTRPPLNLTASFHSQQKVDPERRPTRKNFLRIIITRKRSSNSTPSSCSTSASGSGSVEELDTNEQAEQCTIMPDDDSSPSRSLSVSIPTRSPPQYARRPTLSEILSNSAPPPWTLTAFMAYLSNNHCLETLEFTMDAGRYKKHYNKMMSRAAEKGASYSTKDADNIKVLWTRLIDAYIKPNGSREVNLPSEVRDPILNLDYSVTPPVPETLDPAVGKIYELMEDSVLVPFLNSVIPQSAHPVGSNYLYNTSEEDVPMTAQSFDDKSRFSRRSKQSRNSPPSVVPVEPLYSSQVSPSSLNRKSAPSNLTAAITRSRFSSKLSPTSSGASPAPVPGPIQPTSGVAEAGQLPALTDDGASTDSPSNASPMTPPISPPAGDLGSPRPHRDSGTWKKFGRLSQWKPMRKKSDQNIQDS